MLSLAWQKAFGDADLVGSSPRDYTYKSISFSVAGQETQPEAVLVSADGMTMHMCGTATGFAYEYDLANAFRLDSASYSGNSFDFASQDTAPRELRWDDTGDKLFMLGTGMNKMYQYSTATPYKLTGLTYDSVDFAVGITSPQGLAFRPDGLRFHVVSSNGDVLRQYAMSSAFDLSTASYLSVSVSVADEDATPNSIAWSEDGLTLYMIGNANRRMFRYSVDEPYDIAAQFRLVDSFYLDDALPTGMDFSPDYSRMYISGNSANAVLEYSLADLNSQSALGTGNDIATAVLISLFTDRRALDTDPIGQSSDLRGYWGDAFPVVDGHVQGSRLWTLERYKDLADTALVAKEMADEALAWMVADGIAAEVLVEAERLQPSQPPFRAGVAISVAVRRPDEPAPQYVGPWEIYYAV